MIYCAFFHTFFLGLFYLLLCVGTDICISLMRFVLHAVVVSVCVSLCVCLCVCGLPHV
jgi:hypothetical protein